MKTTHPSYKLIILSIQLVLLGGCGWLESPVSKPPTNPPIDVSTLKDGEKKCLATLKDGLEKYRDSFKRDIGELGTPPVTWQIITAKAKNWVLPVPAQINECKGLLDKSAIKDSVQLVTVLSESNDVIRDSKLDIRAKEDKIKEKVGSIKLSQTEDPSNNPSELMPRQFIKYIDDKLQELMKLLVGIPSPISLQNEELQKQITAHTIALANQNEKIEQLENSKNIMMSVVFLLLPVVGVAGYFLGRGSKLPNPSDDSQTKDRSPKQDRKTKQSLQDRRQNPLINDDKTPQKAGLRGLGRKSPITHEPSNPLINNETTDRHQNFHLNNKNQSRTNDRSSDRLDETASRRSQGDASAQYQNPDPVIDKTTFPKNIASERLTEELAIDYYNNGTYNLLHSYSKGYYDATSDSMMRNREFWGNSLELFEDFDGLFWIIQTVEPYFLLLPNPSKRIAKTRLPGFEYFFETNFKSENYQFCQVVSPAYMDYVNGKWAMTQKGVLNFVY
jgi:hypothetical protein